MPTFRFREFTVYQRAREFRKLIHGYIRVFPKEQQYRLVDQIERACASVMLNIAEGSAKRSDRDFVRFLEIAIASVNEVVAGFDCAVDDSLVDEKVRLHVEESAEVLAKQIGCFIRTLRKS